jgi:hypothetical protein
MTMVKQWIFNVCKSTIYLTSTTFTQTCNEIVKDDQLKHIQKGYN